MKKMSTEEKLKKCIDFLKKFNEYRFWEDFDDCGNRMYFASDVDEMKDKIWHLLADITD